MALLTAFDKGFLVEHSFFQVYIGQVEHGLNPLTGHIRKFVNQDGYHKVEELPDLGIIQPVPVAIGQRIDFRHHCRRFSDNQLHPLQSQCGGRAVSDVVCLTSSACRV